jgi:UDP-N-acetylglucosamine--N-acetylmuramyl-(pentapeptide) pyrophosphoryl-undecaprenol N-acetylglucosamine transferase
VANPLARRTIPTFWRTNNNNVSSPVRGKSACRSSPHEATNNQTIEQSRSIFSAAGIQVIQIVGGTSDLEEISEPEFRRIRYLDQMQLAIEASDFAVSRAGAATVSEFSAVGLPALFIPYPVGNGEQRHNLQDVLSQGGALTISDKEFTLEYVRSTLIPILSDSNKISQMSEATKRSGVLDGAERFISLIDEVLSRR